MEENGVIVFAWLIARYDALIGEGDGRAGMTVAGFRVETQLRQMLRWIRQWRIDRRTAARDNNAGGLFENLVRVRIDCVGGPCKGTVVPNVDERPCLERVSDQAFTKGRG